MALGLAFGRDNVNDPPPNTPEAKEQLFEFRNRSAGGFVRIKKEFGSTMCGDIRLKIMGKDYDTMDPKQRQQFLDDGGRRNAGFRLKKLPALRPQYS